MKPQLEIEYKMLLTESQFEHLVSYFPKASVTVQVNHYFDSIPSLKERKMACRIRSIEENNFFTLKVKQEKNDGNLEIEFPIPSYSLNHPEIQEVFKKYSIHSLKEVGVLTTTRHLIEFNSAVLCLDKSTYNGHTDFEVEYELKDPDDNTLDLFLELLKLFNISYVENTCSKCERCLCSLPNKEL